MTDVSTHPDYSLFRTRWQQLADVADGSGGFLSGDYLIPHPREWKDHDAETPRIPTPKLLERKRLARYDFLATLIVETKLAALFRQGPVRRCRVEGHPYLAWVRDVTGAGQPMTEYLREAYRSALIFGHVFSVIDRAADDGPTGADRAPLRLHTFDPLSVTDWLTDETGALSGVQLEEAVPRAEFGQSAQSTLRLVTQVRPTGARRFVSGDVLEPASLVEVDHGFGALPVVPIYAHRRAGHAVIGQSALYDPMLYIDLYNLTSEVRELLRKQTFSILNVPLGTSSEGGPSTTLEQAQALLGQSAGTTSVLFSTQPAAYISADVKNVTAYMDVIAQLIRHICRLTATPYDQDSREAESAEARRLKRADFETVLGGYADELQRAELTLAQLWFRGTYGPERWQAEWDRAGLEIVWPASFEMDDFSVVLAQSQAALALPLGESRTFRREHSARLVEKLLPGLSEDQREAITAEVDAIPTAEEMRLANRQALADRLTRATNAPSAREIA
ncbi:hypothetical protein TBR22_A32020 [Luteitalea sp. TBR-22]|uniref:hypothetical protein n=1 Tax=Luteitalea sp. TBR-22 TaxID=2802971 RepID=UPI001AF55F75|nr:hypothetical protein [Luteitalea sp. TBR-22]BCS33973.1 hypothetical protein TBR22_A32020 [Luteitalea sp. TBR-22]